MDYRIKSGNDEMGTCDFAEGRGHARTLGEGLEGDDCEGLLDPFEGLELPGDEVADVAVVGQVALDEEVVLARGRVDLRDLLDRLHRRVRDLVGAA